MGTAVDISGAPAEGAGSASTSEIVRVEDLVVRYQSRQGLMQRRRTEIAAVDGVSFTIERGATLGIVGGTGSGKSTIAHVIMGMVRPSGGTVLVDGKALHERPKRGTAERSSVQVVLQDPYSSLDPRMRVGEIIAEPLTLGSRVRGAERARVDQRVSEVLGLVGLSARKKELFPHQFSGGQRQRIAIARALAYQPRLVVLDEPTSALDVSVRAQILTLLKDLQTRLGLTYLVISHDLVTVAYLSTTVMVMHLGRVVERGPREVLYRAPRHPYTQELLASAPGATGTFVTDLTTARIASESLPPEACRFAFRCPLRLALGAPSRCVEADPTLVEVAPAHGVACHFHDAAYTHALDDPSVRA